jgi:CRP-like cAMP-binding protein
VDVFQDDAYRCTRKPGDCFGEVALLRDSPRTATVRAHAGVVLLALERVPFLEAVTGQAHSKRAADALAEERMAPMP